MTTVKGKIPPPFIPVLLCGGTGSRLWPLSRGKKPKQLLPIINDTTLLHDTLKRIEDCIENSLPSLITITTKKLETNIKNALIKYNKHCANHLLIEPTGKNTAAALAYTALYAKKKFGANTLLWIVPSDHYIENNKVLKNILDDLRRLNKPNTMTTLGIKPTSPQTNYGYIQSYGEENKILPIKNFIEKPNQAQAITYIEQKNYFWNSGMLIASSETLLNEFKQHAPHILLPIQQAFEYPELLKSAYKEIENISFDHAIMEKTDKAFVYKAVIEWSDVGSWKNIWNVKKNLKGSTMTPKIYGIKNCDTMKKTFEWLDAQSIAYKFHDYKKENVDAVILEMAIKTHGWENVINKRGTTWRNLSEDIQNNMDAKWATEIAVKNPSIIKRPLLLCEDKIYLGFKEEQYTQIFNK